MSLTAIKALRDAIKADTELQDYFTDNFSKPAGHYIGYKHSKNMADYPLICYVPNKSMRSEAAKDFEMVSLIIGVHAPGITDDIFDGVAHCAAIEELIINNIILPGVISRTVTITRKAEVTTDLGLKHPFYQSEIALTLELRGF